MSMTIGPAPDAGGQPSGEPARRVNPARTFTGFLHCLEDGQLAHELTVELAKIHSTLSDHALEHGGSPKASLSLTVNFELAKGTFEITATTTTKLPKPPRDRTIMWGTPDGQFSPNNPKQLNMNFHDVNAGARGAIDA